MPVDIRYAGFDQDTERRIRFAANALATTKQRILVSDWDGTRCDLLVINGNDHYALSVAAIARRRDMPIVALSRQREDLEAWATWLPPDASVAVLARTFAEALEQQARGRTEAATAATQAAPAMTASTSGLVRLASDPTLAGHDVEAVSRGRVLRLLPGAGRVLASSFSDMLAGHDFLADRGWEFRRFESSRAGSNRFEFAGSLDSFLLNAALKGSAQLPVFPAGRYWLCDWPDVGQAPDFVPALRIIRQLLCAKLEPAELMARSGATRDQVTACLWAFRASGLLYPLANGSARTEEPLGTTRQPSSRFSGLLSRLASHFGL